MRRWHAFARAGSVVAAGAVGACQVVSGIASLDIVGDAGSEATAEAAPPNDAEGDSPGDSTVEASADGTAEAPIEAASDSSSGDTAADAMGDAESGGDATVDSGDAGTASDATGGGDATQADASEGGGGDASDAGDAGDGPVEGGCTFGWQCPAGYCGPSGVCAEPPSCVGLAKTCGPGGNEDCCASIELAIGDGGIPFYRSYDGPMSMYTSEANPATLAGPFALDKFEVTVERFEQFIAAYTGAPPTAGSGAYPPVAGTGWQSTWPYPASQSALLSSVTSITSACTQPFAPASGTPTTAHLPMNCVDWYLAFQFCAWDGSRLATEAEWSFVAGGGNAQRIYPWLVGPPQIDSTFAWYDCTGMGTMEPDGGPGPCTLPSGPLPVGSFTNGEALYGQADMAGSMLEPTMDLFGSYPNPCVNCVNTSSASGERVYRGGSWMDPPGNLDDGYRSGVTPTSGGANTGIRCAR